MQPGQQLIQQHTERVDVGGDGDRLAEQLLGRRVIGRQRATVLLRERRRVAGQHVVFEQLGDAEVEQLRAAFVVDQHVRGLDVAMDDQVGMRVRDRTEDLQEQPDAPGHIESMAVAVPIDGLAPDVLHHQIRLTGRRQAGVGEVGDVGMREAREDLDLAPEAFAAFLPDHRRVEQLDGDGADEAAVAASCEPHAAHAALADEGFEGVGAEHLALEAAVEEVGRDVTAGHESRR